MQGIKGSQAESTDLTNGRGIMNLSHRKPLDFIFKIPTRSQVFTFSA